MTVAFLGLTGPLGALPRPYTELVMQRIRKGDFALRDFFDIFNHRLIQAFARAGEKYRFYFNHAEADLRERARRVQGEQRLRAFFLDERPQVDLFAQILLDLTGAGTPLLRYHDSQRSRLVPRHDIPDSAIRFYSGHLTQSHRCAISLARMMTDYFRVAAEIISFVGQWIQLPVEHQTCLRPSRAADEWTAGARLAPGQFSHPRLGQNAVVGSRVFEVQGHFRVRLGPLTFDQFKDFLPIGEKYPQVAHFVRLYVGPTFDFDLQPVLIGDEVPWCQLGANGSRAPRLGWNTWLRNREFTANVDDAIFRVPDEVSMSS
jgi:type VI secretion system protein ImpH